MSNFYEEAIASHQLLDDGRRCLENALAHLQSRNALLDDLKRDVGKDREKPMTRLLIAQEHGAYKGLSILGDHFIREARQCETIPHESREVEKRIAIAQERIAEIARHPQWPF